MLIARSDGPVFAREYNLRMELRELEWFIALAEAEHMTEAALELHISQPTLSRALARIERKLGVKLFDRHQNRLRINKYGEIFRAHAIRAMDEINRGEERIAALIDPDKGVVSLGYVTSFGGWLIPEFLNRFREVVPGISFELRGDASESVVDALRQGRIDIAFVAPAPAADDLEWIPLGREHLCLSVPPDHPFRERETITISDLADEPMVALKAGYGLRSVTDRLCREAGFTPRIEIETTELSTLRTLVAAGMGVALVPELSPDRASTGFDIPFAERTVFRDYGAATRLGGPRGRAARRFLQFVGAQAVAPDPDERADSDQDADGA